MAITDTVSLELIARQQSQLLDEICGLRQESREIRRAFTSISEHFSRQERRLGDLRDDLEGMIKLEIGGSIANLETRIETYVDGRLRQTEAKLDAVMAASIGD